MKTYSKKNVKAVTFFNLQVLYGRLDMINNSIETLEAFDITQEHHIRVVGEKSDFKLNCISLEELLSMLNLKKEECMQKIYDILDKYGEEMKNDESE